MNPLELRAPPSSSKEQRGRFDDYLSRSLKLTDSLAVSREGRSVAGRQGDDVARLPVSTSPGSRLAAIPVRRWDVPTMAITTQFVAPITPLTHASGRAGRHV